MPAETDPNPNGPVEVGPYALLVGDEDLVSVDEAARAVVAAADGAYGDEVRVPRALVLGLARALIEKRMLDEAAA